jgi:hypothetical protein
MAVENILKIYPGMSDGATTKGLFGAFDSDGEVAQIASAGAAADGVLSDTVSAAGEAVGLKSGIVEVITGAAVTKGDNISADAAGKAVTATTGYVLGRALETASGADVRIKALVPGFPRYDSAPQVKVGTITVTGFTSTGVKAAWQNPEAATIIIHGVAFNRTTAATGANTADIGTTATNATTTSDNLFDGLDTNAAARVNSNLLAADAGTNGRPAASLAAGKWVTYDSKTGDATGLVGKIHIYYSLA